MSAAAAFAASRDDMDVVLGIDCSTTAVKCIAWDAEGVERAVGRAAVALSTPRPGYGEQDPEDWWRGTCVAVRATLAELGACRVRAIAVTHQRETFACLRADGAAIRPAMLWLDSRATAEVAQYGTERVHALTGKPPNTTPAYYKIRWLAAHEPDVLPQTAHLVDVHAYLVHRFTGRWVTSVASADPLGLVDLEAADYSDELLAEAGLSRAQLPDLVEPGALIADVLPAVAEDLGLPVGVAVVAGAGDGQCAGLGAGVIVPGRSYLNIGTGLISGSFSERYQPSRAYRAMAGTMSGSVNYEIFVGAGTFLVSWFLDQIADDAASGGAREQHWEQRAARVPRGSGGLFVLPYWNGQLTPEWDHDARGVMLGFSAVHTRAHIYRAVLEGIAFELRWCLEVAEPEFPAPITELVAMGGGARSPFWCQLIADVLRRPLVLVDDEATSLGAAILAAVGVGLHRTAPEAVAAMIRRGARYEPDPVAAAHYDRLFSGYREVYPALRPVFPRLSEVRDVS